MKCNVQAQAGYVELLVICFRYQKSCFKNKMHLYFITIIMSYNSLRWSDPDLADHD
jgi:hypothetical protein